MRISRRGLAALATTAAAVAVGTVVATPAAYAATVHGTAKASGTTVSFVSAKGKANSIQITRSGRTVTIASFTSGWAIKAGAGCKAVKGDKTKLKCTTAKATKQLKVIFSAKDDDLYNRTTLPVVAVGGAGSDDLYSMGGADRMYGEAGDDFVIGGNGANILSGGPGKDMVVGGSGADRLYGGPGNDILRGQAGADSLSDESGDNSLRGDAGNDTLYGGTGADFMRGGAGNDTLHGNAGTDRLFGDEGDDRLYASPSGDDGSRERVNGGSNVTAFPGDTCTDAWAVADCETLV